MFIIFSAHQHSMRNKSPDLFQMRINTFGRTPWL